MSEFRQARLPEGWKVKKLGDICENLDSKRVPITKNKRKTGSIPYYGASGIVDYVADYLFDQDLLLVSEDGANLLARTYPIAFPVSGKTWVNNHAHVLKFDSLTGQKFIEYYLNSMKLNDYVSGMAQPKLNQKMLNSILVPTPPLETKNQIVAVLDKAFAAIDLAKANIEKNLQNAKELFQSKLNQIFTQKGDGWEEKKLGEVCVVERGSSPRPIKNFQTDSDDGVNWIKIGDTKNVEKYIYSTKEKITTEGSLKSRFVDVGDFILSNSMSFGRPYIMKTKGYIHDGWFVLRLPNDIDTEFFWYLLVSPYTKNQFESLASGAIVKNISGDLVKKAILPIAPLAEQKQIVQQLDVFSAQTKQLEAQYQQKLDDLTELKKSILQKAFAGELK